MLNQGPEKHSDKLCAQNGCSKCYKKYIEYPTIDFPLSGDRRGYMPPLLKTKKIPNQPKDLKYVGKKPLLGVRSPWVK